MKFKKLMLGLGIVLAGGSVFAEAAGPDLSAATTALTNIQSSLSTWSTTAITTLVTIAGAFLVFWLTKLAIGLIKSFTNKAK